MTGTGTETDPYIISTLTDLQAMNDDLDAYYQLANDIDASGTAAWNGGEGFVPIGSSVAPFQGHFDGKGYTITGLTIDRPTTDNVGLFGWVEIDSDHLSIDIRNVILASADITGDDSVGALVGRLVGGYGTGTGRIAITDCITSGSIAGDDKIGGMIGLGTPADDTPSTVTACSSSCAVAGAGADYAGGFIGQAEYLTMYGCQASGAVTGQAGIGGFAGSIGDTATATACLATGNATASGTGAVGYGNVGGFAGVINGGGDCSDCYARGSATDQGNASLGGSAGGFAGNVQSGSTLTRCYATGAPTGSTYQGGFVGRDQSGSYVTCAWDTDTSGEADACGSGAVTGVTGYTTTEMKDGTATVGWSPVDWDLITASNNGYACLLGITPGCTPPTTPNVIGDRTVVVEKPLLELIRNVEVQLDGRFYIDKNGNAIYESRFHRSG